MDIRAADIVKNFPIVDDIAPRAVKSARPWSEGRTAFSPAASGPMRRAKLE